MSHHRRFAGARAPALRLQGSALIVVLLLLVVAMMMAVVSVRTATLEERMAGNTRDRQVAFQMAEAALRDAEQAIATGSQFSALRTSAFTSACTNGLCSSAVGVSLALNFTDAEWAGTKTWAYGAATSAAALAGVAEVPRYAIEYQGTAQPIEPGMPCVALFLITARARGTTATAEALLQSVYRHRAGACFASI